MRILIYSKKKKSEFNEIISFLEKERLIIVDYFNDIDEAEYCAEIRKYDKCIIESEINMRKYVNFLKELKDYNSEAQMIFFGEEKDTQIINYYLKNEKYFSNINDIEIYLKEILFRELKYKNIIIDVKDNKKIWIIKDNKKKEIQIKTKIDFFLLTYFLRHHEEKININRLIDAISKEPELTKSSIAETSISSIRRLFKEELGTNPIKAFKKIGYRFSY